MDTQVAVSTAPVPAPTSRDPSPALKITPKVSEALNRMIESGETYQQAAEAVGMHVRAMRKALDKPHVLNELRRRKHVFRAAISAANISRLAAIRDQSSNQMAALGAIKTLEQIDDDAPNRAAASRLPGVTIQIINAPQQSPAKPMIGHDNVTITAGGDGE